MARGCLYCIHGTRDRVEFDDLQGVKEYFTQLSTGLDDDPALHAKVSAICSDLSYYNRADDTIEGIENEADWLMDIDDWQDNFIMAIRVCNGVAFRFEDYVIFRMSQANIETWFEGQFERFKQRAAGLSLSDFCEHGTSWDLRNEISCVWSDAAIYDGFEPLDEAIRLLNRDEWYIASNAMIMH